MVLKKGNEVKHTYICSFHEQEMHTLRKRIIKYLLLIIASFQTKSRNE
jgi:histidinol phosphatase-like enzyme